ncbi:hypothetical protein ACFYZE_33480 [Streptomyces sp. NPDC001796]|uniref:hypothetical protein n=1 Tax=Streptomyces sp. NPDC001796 TaxID=3364609 RepID=UPI0036CF80BD
MLPRQQITEAGASGGIRAGRHRGPGDGRQGDEDDGLLSGCVVGQASRSTIRKALDMLNAIFAAPCPTTFCRLDEIGLETVGQRLEPDRAVIECRHPAAFTD